MAPQKTKPEQLMRDAVRNFLASPAYTPGSLPAVQEQRWPACFPEDLNAAQVELEAMGDDGLAAKERRVFSEKGITIFPLVLFLMMVDDLADKPAGFSKAVVELFKAHDMLKRVAERINPDLLEGISTRVDGGMYELVGLQWELLDRNTQALADLFTPIFSPLLRVAGEQYLIVESKKKAKQVAKKASSRETIIPGSVQFLINARKISREASDPIPNVNASSFAPPRIPPS
ncbi:hypothetical protein C8R46DRAFT_1193695 [Mycena filopes]|nr:hypothetical protein C8R46DRAFT_1193695 [Mycena filopes]